MRTKKVDAFTLSELLVVLVVSSIVISLTFVILGLVQKQIREIQSNLKDQQEIQFLERILLQDINTHRAFYRQQKDELFLVSNKDTILYHLEKEYLVRLKDTIKLRLVEKQFFLDGKQIKNGWFDAIGLRFNQSYTSKNILVFKVKDAAHYLNK
ncbi:MAG: prepilin-type N-terminal cleavage/methylation domain-containing protein [Polaribacter sp.]|nr:prepilin-type N-terminal cleavage/methylation domain-containing protein [Polaribacter sp.]